MPGPYSTAKGRAHPVSGKARPVCMQLYQLKQLPAERGQGQLQFTFAGLADQPLRLLGPAAEALPVGVQQLRQLAARGRVSV